MDAYREQMFDLWKFNPAGGNQVLMKEQPDLQRQMFRWTQDGKRDLFESRMRARIGQAVYFILEMQAEADRLLESLDGGPINDTPLLPYVTQEAIDALNEDKSEAGETDGNSTFSTYRRLLVEQPALAVEIEDQVGLARDELEGMGRIAMAENVYRVLEWQAATNRINEQLNPGL
jgi:hypothetical protein